MTVVTCYTGGVLCCTASRYFSFLVDCEQPKACTILLRGASKDVLSEMERNLQDAMNVARSVLVEPYLCPGGGATEMALAHVRPPDRKVDVAWLSESILHGVGVDVALCGSRYCMVYELMLHGVGVDIAWCMR